MKKVNVITFEGKDYEFKYISLNNVQALRCLISTMILRLKHDDEEKRKVFLNRVYL